MELLEVVLPKKIIIGKGALNKIGNTCKNLGLKDSVSLFTDSNVMRIVGKNVLEILKSYDYDVKVNILPEKIETKDLTGLKSDFTIGLGGGKSIDAAKMAAKKNNIPFISIPTAMSHDGIASNRAVIDVYSAPAVMPTGIIIDTSVIADSPYRLTASGCGDMIAKLTAVADWELSHEKTGEYISEYASNINKSSANLIIDSASSIKKLEAKGLRNLIEALVFSGVSMSIAGSSRPASGSEHMFSHALKGFYPEKTSLHGEECGIGAVLCSYLHDMDWERVLKALKIIGLPTNSEEMKIPEEIIVKALSEAKHIRTDRYTILNYKNVDLEKAKEAAKATGVI